MSSRVKDTRTGCMFGYVRGFLVIKIHEFVDFLCKGSVTNRGLFAHCSGFLVFGVINITALFI